MKRSEMFDIIYNVLGEDLREGYNDTYNLTDKLLEAIEKSGMLPPKKEVYEFGGYIDVFEWEKE